MRRTILLGTLAFALGCAVTGPDDVQRVEGKFCEAGKPDVAVREAESWRVTIFYNFSTVRDVVEDGVHRYVEFRSCASETCMIDPAFAPTSDEAIAACRNGTGLPNPLVSG
jgi:hypothetical protein